MKSGMLAADAVYASFVKAEGAIGGKEVGEVSDDMHAAHVTFVQICVVCCVSHRHVSKIDAA